MRLNGLALDAFLAGFFVLVDTVLTLVGASWWPAHPGTLAWTMLAVQALADASLVFRRRAPMLVIAILGGFSLLISLLIPRAGFADEPSAREPGVWQKHEYSFVFMGFTSTYSCDGLADKIKLLLIAAGARHDAKSQPGACANGFGRPDKFARASLTFYTLAPGGPDTPQGTNQVDGVWGPVAIADRSPRDLGTGDCELVEQFRNNVLPMFTTRNVDDHTTCVPHQDSGSVIGLRFESFTAAPHAPRGPPDQSHGK